MSRYVNVFDSYVNSSGQLLIGATLTFYFSRSNEKRAIFSDAEQTTEQTNPQTSDANGRFSNNIFLADIFYRVVLRDSDGVLVASTSDGKQLPFIRSGTAVPSFNLAPVLTLLETFPIEFQPSDPDIAVTSTIVISDADSTDLVSATIAIDSVDFVSGEDVLTFSDTGSITGVFSAGTMTLTGETTLANYQAALRAVDYQNVDATPTAGTRRILFTVTDTEGYATSVITTTLGSGETVTTAAIRNVVIQGGDSPVLAAIEGATLELNKTVGSNLTSVLTSTITVADADSANMASGYVQITNNYVKFEDILQFTDTANITAVFDNSVGRITLTGADTKAAYQTAFRAVDYFNSTDPATVQTRTSQFAVTDSDGNISNFQTRLFSVTTPAIPDVPSTQVATVTFNPSGNYFSLGSDESPYVWIYTVSANNIFTKLSNPTTLPVNIVNSVKWSPNSIYLAVAFNSPSPYMYIYKQDGDTFTALPNPSSLPDSTCTGASWSSDSVYLSYGFGPSPRIIIYKRSGDVFTKLSNPSPIPTSTVNDTEFSPNSTYLSVGIFNSPYINIYKRAGDVFTKLSNPSSLPTGSVNSSAWTSDSVYLAVGHGTDPNLTIYKRAGDVFTKLSDPSTLPTAFVKGCAFSPDDVYLAVGHGASPWIIIYKRAGDVFTKLPNPDDLPANTGQGVAWNNDGTLLAVGEFTGGNIITIYSRDGDTFTKIS